jgi:hypothetical protein
MNARDHAVRMRHRNHESLWWLLRYRMIHCARCFEEWFTNRADPGRAATLSKIDLKIRKFWNFPKLKWGKLRPPGSIRGHSWTPGGSTGVPRDALASPPVPSGAPRRCRSPTGVPQGAGTNGGDDPGRAVSPRKSTSNSRKLESLQKDDCS